MNTEQFLIHGWTWNPAVWLISAAALFAYLALFGLQRRLAYFGAALGVFLLTLVSQINTLANGYLFSAHMLQHMLLLLIVPAFLLLSLPPSFELPKALRPATHTLAGWAAGVGSMWLWHLPVLCNASAELKSVFAIQTVSLLICGSLFWWQVIAPREQDRLSPPGAIAYLFTACTACSVLGIILTFSPVTVCTVYLHPADRLGLLPAIRGWGMTSDKDQQIGGLLMWVPMCMIYLTAICGQIVRWFGNPAESPAPGFTGKI